jgi:hypothetical protein
MNVACGNALTAGSMRLSSENSRGRGRKSHAPLQDSITESAEPPMKVFDIPYSPDAAAAWCIPIPGDGEKHFDQRADALEFARTLTRKLEQGGDGPNFICVEGADGRWRLFDSDFKPAA